MARWMLKAFVQRSLGFLPASHKWNEWFQQTMTHSLDFTPGIFEGKMAHCRRHRSAVSDCSGITVFDLGTGWFPVVPVGLFLTGAKQVYTCDISPLLKMSRVRAVLQAFVDAADQGQLESLLPGVWPDRVEQVCQVLRSDRFDSPQKLLRAISVEVLVRDARQTELPSASIDLFVSTETLGHIPEQILIEIFREFQRIAAPQGTMSHIIDMADQHSYFDRSITPFHNLRFSRTAWRLIDNPIIPMNRLRINDYRRLVRQAGFAVLREANRRGRASDLSRVPLAKPFRDYATEDLLVIKSHLVARADEPDPVVQVSDFD